MVLAGHWKFDGNAQEESRRLVTATEDNIVYVNSTLGQAAQFNGTTSEIKITDDALIQNIWAGGGTIAFLINPNNDGEDNEGRIVEKTQWLTQVREESAAKMRIGMNMLFTGNNVWETTGLNIAANKYTHVIIIYNSDSADNDPTIYINNNSVAVTNTSRATGTIADDTGDAIRIGTNSTNASTFDGEIDELYIFNNAISAEERQTLFDLFTVGDAASKGVKEIATRWPITDGLTARVNKQTGRITNLIPQQSLLNRRERFGLDGKKRI